MNETSNPCEQLSALADGELRGEEFARAMGQGGTPEGQATWAMYHLVGDVLRSPELAHHGRSDLLAALRVQIAQEPQRPQASAQVLPLRRKPAANVALLRWKMVAGFASLAAVSAIGWNMTLGTGGAASGGAQLAAVSPPAGQLAGGGGEPSQVLTLAQTPVSGQLMLRDPRLDELMATHNEYHGANNLQVPADFLRNANFAAPAPARQR